MKFLGTDIPPIIGLTGGIGAGKSYAAQFFERSGYPVYYSDDAAKDIVTKDEALKSQIISLLGEEAYIDSRYHKEWVKSQILARPEILPKLNALIHPAVAKDFQQWLYRQDACFVLKETALLFELGLEKSCTFSVLIIADEEVRKERVMQRPNMTEAFFKEILSKQWKEDRKASLADYCIENNGSLADFESSLMVLKEDLELRLCTKEI